MSITQEPSAFAQMVDKLRDKTEEELKMLYMQFFEKNLIGEWDQITRDADFKNSSEEDIIKAIQKNRYQQPNV